MKLFEPCIFSHVVPCLLSFSNDYLALSLRSAPVCGIDSFCWSLVAFFLTSLFAYFVFQTMTCFYMSICSYSIFLSFGFTSLFELLSAHFAARSPAACSLRCAPSCGFYSFGLFSLAFFLTSLLASLVFRAMTCFSMSILFLYVNLMLATYSWSPNNQLHLSLQAATRPCIATRGPRAEHCLWQLV